MAGLVKAATFALATSVGVSAFGVVITEDFSTDPTPRGWSGVNNVTPSPGNDYGWRMTDDTGTAVNPPGGTATAAGEIGGFMNRAPNSFYGVSLGGVVDFNTTDMNVKGVLRQMYAESSSTVNIGWSKGIDSVNSPLGKGTNSALYVSWDDGFNGAAPGMRARTTAGDANGGTQAVPNLAPGTSQSGPAMPFEFNWNSTTNTFTFTLNGVANNLVLTEQQVTDMGDLTHWGLFGRTNNDSTLGGAGAHADNDRNQIRIDDVTYTAVPEPASLGLLGLGGLLALRRRSR